MTILTASETRIGKWHRVDPITDPATGLGRFWVSDNGYEIWQGRPWRPASMRFVYRLRRPNGSEQDYRLLASAKRDPQGLS